VAQVKKMGVKLSVHKLKKAAKKKVKAMSAVKLFAKVLKKKEK